MKFKKIIALALVAVIGAVAISGCGKKEETAKTDFETIKEKGELVVGITEFEPMNYKDKDGNWTGFETEFTNAVCDIMGVKAKFQIIDWDSKVTELQNKSIDCIWNGMTVTEELGVNIDFSTSYIKNMQVVVIKNDNASKYTTLESLSSAKLTAEKGSAGEKAVKADEQLKKATYTPIGKQADALLEVKSGTSDAAVIDYVMARKMVGEGTSYADLKIIDGIELSAEEYAVGIRKGSDLKDQVNAAMKTLTDNGKINEIAKKYDLEGQLIANQK